VRKYGSKNSMNSARSGVSVIAEMIKPILPLLRAGDEAVEGEIFFICTLRWR